MHYGLHIRSIMKALDFRLFQLVNQFAGRWHALDRMMVPLSKYGPVLLVLLLVYIWFTSENEGKQAVILASISVAAAMLIAMAIGHIYFRPRPFATHNVHLLVSKSPDASFPSDHATFSFAIASMVWFWNKRYGVVAVLLGALIAVSRVFVGTHYPFDVIGGAVVGSTTSLLAWSVRTNLDTITSLVISIAKKVKLA